jgi:hypothetical protein
VARSPDPRRPALVCALLVCAPLGCDAMEPAPEPAIAPDDSDLAEIQAWLHAGAYLEWERHDPVPAPGMSGGARVYLSPELVASLRAGSSNHPAGSAAVREIVDAEDPTRMIGWALNHKLEAGTGGDAWFFYEVFSTEPDAAPLVAERGAPGCVGCHADGQDFVLSEL